MNYLALLAFAIICEIAAIIVGGKASGILGILGLISAVIYFILPKTVPEKEEKIVGTISWILLLVFGVLLIYRYA
ncbi:MAG: hypothetical protein WCP91_02500 [Candidatus Berkelbacteria bacterium]